MDQMLENSDMSKAELKDEAGIDSDSDYNVSVDEDRMSKRRKMLEKS